MFKRPVEEFSRIWLAVISIVLVTVIAAGLLIFTKIAPGQTEYQGEFAQAASLRAGDQVTVAGIQVGSVDGLQLAGDRVIVTFKVNDNVHLGSASRAAIKLSTLLGSRYLELSPGGDGDLPVRTIALANTQVPYDLQQTLADATTTFAQFDADKIAQSISTLSQSLTGVPAALPEALDNLKSLSTVIADRRDQMGTLLASTDKVTSLIRDQKSALGSLMIQGRNLLAQLAQRRAAVEQLFAGVATLVTKTNGVLADGSSINKMLADVSGLMDKIHKNDALLRNIFQVLPVTLRNVTNATGTAQGIDLNLPMGIFVDSWLCAISTRAKQFQLPEYFQGCKPVPDPFPGWPAPDPLGNGFPGDPPDTLYPLGGAPATSDSGQGPTAMAPPASTPGSPDLAPAPSSEGSTP